MCARSWQMQQQLQRQKSSSTSSLVHPTSSPVESSAVNNTSINQLSSMVEVHSFTSPSLVERTLMRIADNHSGVALEDILQGSKCYTEYLPAGYYTDYSFGYYSELMHGYLTEQQMMCKIFADYNQNNPEDDAINIESEPATPRPVSHSLPRMMLPPSVPASRSRSYDTFAGTMLQSLR